MNTNGLPKESPTWKAEPFWKRVAACRTMLATHGLLTDAESHRVAMRIMKRHMAESPPATPTEAPDDNDA